MHFKSFKSFISESESWKDMDFSTKGEKEVFDVVEGELLTSELLVVEEGDDAYGQLTQLTSSNKGVKVLQVVDHELTKYETPFEFIKWDRLGSDKLPIESCYVIKINDAGKL
jgi:hypothetical protein